jgi:hypothetical protein
MATDDTNTEEQSGPTDMDAELVSRREETWQRLVVHGQSYRNVVQAIAKKYDATESAIETDISRMDDWLPKLDASSLESGVSRLREQRQNRQNLQQLARKAREEGNLEMELKVRRQIDRAIETDVELSQSLGLTDEEPEEVEMTWKDGLEAAVEHNMDEDDDGNDPGDDSVEELYE